MAESEVWHGKSDIKTEVALFMLERLLPLPIVRRSYKLRIYTELTQVKYKQDKPMPKEVIDVQFIGSQYEGLSVTVTSVDGGDAIYAMSDYDTMPILKHYQARDRTLPQENVSADDNKEVNVLEIYEASHPGYCRLKSTKTGKFLGMRFNEDCSGDVCLYHDGLKVGKMNVPYAEVIPGFFEKPDTVEIKKYVHGPAISFTKIQIHPGEITRTGQEVDVVLSMKCQSWPRVALDWFKRQQSGSSTWPSLETIENVKSVGCYVVAVPHPLSKFPREEWRYSFAPAEKILARSLTFAQKGSYIIAKMLFKTALEQADKVSSYCLKTQMFWLCEEESSLDWTYDKVGYYALKVLSKLAKNLEMGVVRHYIIPENNIISHIPASTRVEVSETLFKLVCYPFPVLEKIRRTTKFFGIILHPPEESFQPITTLLEQQTADANEIKSSFRASKFAVIKHYCSMLKKPIVNVVQEEFSKLKFALLMDIAEDIGNDKDIPETVEDIIATVADELLKYTEENVNKWYAYVKEYLKSLSNIKSEKVEQMLIYTYDGILKVEAF